MSSVRDTRIAYTRAGDVNVAYQVFGDGDVNLVYVPGVLNLIEATGEEPAIERHFDRMSAFARVALFDKRGTGLSDRVSAEEMADVESRMADLAAVMDACGMSRAALFATADGAIPAILFAAHHSERVDALVVYAGTARYLASEDYPEGVARDPTPPLEVYNERWGNEDNPLAVKVLAPSMANDTRWRRVLGRMQRRSGTPRAARLYWDTFAREDARDALADVQVPALVMHATGDRMIPVGQGRALARGIAGARFIELPGADHFPWFTNADRVAAETQELLTGSRGGTGGARRLSTVLFIDIVASTERLSKVGDTRWRDLMSDYERLVRADLVRFGGQKLRFVGDGVLALFDDPLAAVDCARALITTVRELGLEIRAGIHTGMVEMRGNEVAGIGVHIAARVMAAAAASEVMVTRTVSDLLLGTDTRLEPRGAHELKGVPQRLELFALAAADG